MHDLPGSLRLTSTFPFVGRSAELERLRTLMPRAEGEGRRVVAARRRAGLGQEPARARVRRRGGRATARSCSTAPATPSCARRTGRSSRRSTSSARATEPDELRAALGTGGGELTRLLPDLAARVGELPPAGRGRPGHRAPPAAHGGRRPARRRHAASRPALLVLEDGHWADAPTLLLLRHLARAPASARDAAARHLPRHRGRRARGALRDARRPAPLRRRRPAAASAGSRATRWPSSSAAPPAATSARAARAGGGDPRPHRRQRVPRLRALARARRDRRRRARRRRDPPHARRRARQPRERPRGREPAALPPRARGRATCSSSPRPPGPSSSSTSSGAPPGSASPSCSRRSTRPSAAA